MREELHIEGACPRPNCRGTMILVLTRYEDHGPLNKEYECTSCSKVRKDPIFAEQRRREYENRKKQRERSGVNK